MDEVNSCLAAGGTSCCCKGEGQEYIERLLEYIPKALLCSPALPTAPAPGLYWGCNRDILDGQKALWGALCTCVCNDTVVCP